MGGQCSCFTGTVVEAKNMELLHMSKDITQIHEETDSEIYEQATVHLFSPLPTFHHENLIAIHSVSRGYLARRHINRIRSRRNTMCKDLPYRLYTSSFDKITAPAVKILEAKYGLFILRNKMIDSIEVEYRPAVLLSKTHVYEGEWDLTSKRPHGRGMEILPNGTKYVGFFRKRKRYGIGRIIYPNGTMYQGKFKRGQPKGSGLIVNEEGSEYEGFCRNGLPNGKGRQK